MIAALCSLISRSYPVVEPEPQSESALIEQLRAREPDAYTHLVTSCGPRMLAVARRMLSIEEDARDAVQDAFLSAFKALPTFDGRSQLATWLHRITVNACLMKLRTRRRRPECSIEELLPTFLSDGHQTRSTKPCVSGHDEPAVDSQLAATVREKLHQIPEQYRTVLILRDIEGYSTEHTAAALGLSPNAVKTRLHRARQALRTLIEPALHRPEHAP